MAAVALRDRGGEIGDGFDRKRIARQRKTQAAA
jgi:hypothetical protein